MCKDRVKTLLKAQALAIDGTLYAPKEFVEATLDELLDICNGCGAADSWFRPPRRIYGTLIVYACHIHDWMYNYGKVKEDKDEADRVMENNINRLITIDSEKWYKPTFLQRRRAKKYYLAVKHFGGEAFWAGKNQAYRVPDL